MLHPRVYNNGVKTIIQMPAGMSQSETPILRVVRKDGGLFTDEESVQVATGCKAIAISLTVF